MNTTDEYLLDVLSILPPRVPPDEDAIIQDAVLREQLMVDIEQDEIILHH